MAFTGKGKETMNKPYISVVITTRNDNYGDNMLQRLHMFVQSLDHHAEKYPDLFELIIVEWNPPADTDPLQSIVPVCKNLRIKIVTVPSTYHHLSNKSPMDEFKAKNVGIRKSTGEFVLITNPDVIISYDMVNFLTEKTLEDNLVYRCDRYDFDGTGIDQVEPSNYMKFALTKIFCLHAIDGATSSRVEIDISKIKDKIPVSNHNGVALHTNAAGDFILLSRKSLQNVEGLYEGSDCPGHHDSVSMVRFFTKQLKFKNLIWPLMVLHHDHDRHTSKVDWDQNSIIQAVNNCGSQIDWGLANKNLQEWKNYVD